MDRFFIPPEWIAGDKVILRGGQAHQIARVLRLKTKSHIIVLDNTGWEYELAIEKVGGELVEGKVINKTVGAGEPAIKITLYQAMLKADKFEFVLQKGVELGVSSFVPYISERCVAKKPLEGKMPRWQKIVLEAAEQSERSIIPTLHPAISFREACEIAMPPVVLLWEEENKTSLRQVLHTAAFQEASAISVFIGPEGGFPAEEVRYALSRGIASASLGTRILRAETAALAVIGAVFYDRGELG